MRRTSVQLSHGGPPAVAMLTAVKDARQLVVATDGSCLGNPGPGGWAWAVTADCWAAGGHRETTNNLMELRAVFEALGVLPASRALVIETDSEYVINIFTKWLDGWVERRWRTANRKPVQNVSAIQQVQSRLIGRKVTWRHVKGHSGHVLNEVADRRARAAAAAVRDGRRLDAGPPGCVDHVITSYGSNEVRAQRDEV
jgi:ribonuclease HI